tara:strand:+ start:45889 stop:46647 length:759 start_codon:yes stop_codon:yes gene_type:complete
MLLINNWTGRLGNNILQILRAIHFAKLNKHSIIKFKPHSFLSQNVITLDDYNRNKEEISGDFFNLSKFNIIDPEPIIMKEHFQKYIAPIFKIKKIDKINNDNTIYIHIRSGDIFNKNPHPAYVQPPFSYYKNIIDHYNSVNLIFEDNKNPCVNELLKINKVTNISGSLNEDLQKLSSAKNLVIGFGTFGFLLYLINQNLKNIYIPKYFIDTLPKGSWGDDINIHIVNLPKYINIGEWKNTFEQRKIMLEYQI